MRKERKIRPGFTPQEDVARFRSTRQQAKDSRVLPKGHIPGWAPPGAAPSENTEPQSKSAKKNEKRREKRKEKRQEAVQENWDSETDEDVTANPVDKEARATQVAGGWHIHSLALYLTGSPYTQHCAMIPDTFMFHVTDPDPLSSEPSMWKEGLCGV